MSIKIFWLNTYHSLPSVRETVSVSETTIAEGTMAGVRDGGVHEGSGMYLGQGG